MFSSKFCGRTLTMAAFFSVAAFAQPKTAPTTPDAPCVTIEPTSAIEKDTVVSTPDDSGYYSIFDGSSLKGWWQDCKTSHSSNQSTGAIFKADPVHKAIYAMSREGNGGILATNKKYAHYELIFDWWPQYGNDGGIFNRMTFTGSSNQMVLDYLGNSGILGMYSESFPGNRNQRPWSYNTETSVTIPGSGGDGGPASNWTNTTKGLNPTKYGCAASGCVQADLLRLWNLDGWNQVRIQYYGGLTTAQSQTGDKIRTNTFFRKFYPVDTTVSSWVPGVTDTATWVPVIKDSLVLSASDAAKYPKSWLGLQVHGGNRYVFLSNQGLGSWYRNLKIRELDENGKPISIPVGLNKKSKKMLRANFELSGNALLGTVDLDHDITFSDVSGKILKRVSGHAGESLAYDLPQHSGVMLVRIKTIQGVQNLISNRVSL